MVIEYGACSLTSLTKFGEISGHRDGEKLLPSAVTTVVNTLEREKDGVKSHVGMETTLHTCSTYLMSAVSLARDWVGEEPSSSESSGNPFSS